MPDPDKTPCVYVCNHTSATNGPVLYACLKGSVVPLVAKDWFVKPVWKPWLKASGCIPCDRYGLDTEWIRLAKRALDEGRSVLIFPEGRVRKDGTVNEFKPGFACLAALTGAPVVPLTVCGRYTVLRHARIAVGVPVSLERKRAMDAGYLRAQSAAVRETVIQNRALYSNERKYSHGKLLRGNDIG